MKNLLLKYKTILLSIFSFILISYNSMGHFGSKGPFGGSVSCAAVYDTMVYIGTNSGGVFFSTRQTLVGWSSKPVGLKSGKITALVHTGKYLLAATADSGVFIYTGFVGSDRYWNKINNGLSNLKITSLVAIDSITVLAGTNGGGIFKTTNRGASWTAANNPVLSHYNITGLIKVGSRIIHTSDGGVFASDDDGTSWINFNDVNTSNINATAISYNSVTDEILISNSNGLYISSSAGTTSTPSYTASLSGLTAGAIVHSVSNNGTNWYLATDKGVFTSPTGIINWVTANTGLSNSALDVNAVIPFQARLVIGTNKEGVFKSPSSAVNWTINNTNFNNINTYSMVSGGANLVIAATDKGIFVSVDLAASYASANNGLTDSLNVTDLALFGNTLLASTKNQGVFISADTGKHWTTFNVGLSTFNIKKIIASNANVYALGTNGNVYKSSGFSWVLIQNGLPGGVVPTSLAFSGNNVLLGTLGNGVYIKAESGTIWIASNAGLINLNVTSVTALGNKIFAGTDGSGVYVSDANSVSWIATSNTTISHTNIMGLNGQRIQAMASNGGYVYASYKGGLLATSDNGTTWIAGGNQFNLPSYTDVTKISFVTTRVFVTTENNSLYSNSLSELPSVPILTSVYNGVHINSQREIIISPNPNNGIFNIDYSTLSSAVYEVSLFDYSGKLMEKHNEAVTQISSDYPGGIYYLQIRTNTNEIISKKIAIE